MILLDTSAIYALADRHDRNHERAKAFLNAVQGAPFYLSWLIVGESATLLEGRLGMASARAFWADVSRGAFQLLPLDEELLGAARQIDDGYSDLNMGLVDCASLALCERHRIETVFTFDRRHFGAYRPGFATHLDLVPS